MTDIHDCEGNSHAADPVRLISTPGQRRMVVLILRGAMDGLDAVASWPSGSAAWRWSPLPRIAVEKSLSGGAARMDKEHLQAIGTVIGAAAAAMVAWIVGRKEARRPADPPPERPPTTNEIKAVMEALRDDLARLHTKVDRHGEISEDEWRDINRKLDRIETAQLRATLVQDWRDRTIPPNGQARE